MPLGEKKRERGKRGGDQEQKIPKNENSVKKKGKEGPKAKKGDHHKFKQKSRRRTGIVRHNAPEVNSWTGGGITIIMVPHSSFECLQNLAIWGGWEEGKERGKKR